VFTPPPYCRPPSPPSTSLDASNAQRPKNIPPLRSVFWYGLRLDPVGSSRDRRRPRALVTPILRTAAASSWGGARAGARETGGGRATEHLSWAAPGGDPASRPTPNTQRPTPNAQRPTPNAQRPTPRHKAQLQLALRCTWRNGEHTIVALMSGASECLIEAAVRRPRRQPTPRGWPCRAPNGQRPTPRHPRSGRS
jgi:hypothetical protein